MIEQLTFRPLLRLRKRHEDVARQAFTEAQTEVQSIEAFLADLHAGLSHCDEMARQAIRSKKPIDLGQYRRAVGDIRLAMAAQATRLEQANLELARRRDVLVEATRQRQVAGALQEQFDQRLAADRQRQDVKEQDEQHAVRLSCSALSCSTLSSQPKGSRSKPCTWPDKMKDSPT
jgi:flagellar export protein FliJ